jgi:hypothetical protein
VLEVDHVNPRANGGNDDLDNLVTSCWDCNRGKGAKVLDDKAPKIDADIAWLEAQQEIAELKRYQEAKAQRDVQLLRAAELLQEHWWNVLKQEYAPDVDMIIGWIKTFGPDEVEYAIDKAGSKMGGRRMGFDDLVKYAAAIMWHRLRG